VTGRIGAPAVHRGLVVVQRVEVVVAQLDFVRFWSGPSPENAVGCDVVEGLIEG
jgi:hypothetical protein